MMMLGRAPKPAPMEVEYDRVKVTEDDEDLSEVEGHIHEIDLKDEAEPDDHARVVTKPRAGVLSMLFNNKGGRFVGYTLLAAAIVFLAFLLFRALSAPSNPPLPE